VSKRPKRIEKSDEVYRSSSGPIDYVLSRSNARRTLSITIDEEANLSVAVPIRTKIDEVHRFLIEKDHWILRCIEEAQHNQRKLKSRQFADGHRFLFLGKKHTLEVSQADIKRARIEFDNYRWQVTLAKDLASQDFEKTIKSTLTKWYRKQAEEIIGGRIFHYARIIGVEPKKIGIRSQKRLWGICDYNKQEIRINWQIILSPMKVVDYVVVHELCHLIHPNHSKRFWNKVAKYMPDYKEYRAWLSKNHVDMILP